MLKNKRSDYADIFIYAFIMAISAYVFFTANSFKPETRLFPQIISAATFLCSLFKSGYDIFGANKNKSSEAEKTDNGHRKVLFSHKQLYVVLTAIGYVLLLKPIGFIPVTVIVLIVLPMLLGYRNLKILIPFAVLVTIGFFVLFRYGFYVKLPAGILSEIL